MNILVNEQIRLTEVRPTDKPALVEHLNDKEIYDRTLRIPYPYTDMSAEEWLAVVTKTTQEQGRPVQWAIRNVEDHLIGACGFNNFQVGKSDRAEIGYVLGKPFWGRGIMTAVVQTACKYAFEEFGLVKIIAHVNATNPASARVLEKCGFEQEGYLKKHYLKDGQYLDVRRFGLLR